MANYAQTAAQAKVTLTDIGLKGLNVPDSNLRIAGYVKALTKAAEALDALGDRPAWEKFKDAMLDTQEDAVNDRTAREAADLTFQLRHCLHCRCLTCPIIEERCRCEGCLHASRVTVCDGGDGFETRQVDPGAARIDGLELTEAQFDRRSHITTVTLKRPNGLTERRHFNLETGRSNPL